MRSISLGDLWWFHKSWLYFAHKKRAKDGKSKTHHIVQCNLIILRISIRLTSCLYLYCLLCAHMNFKHLEYSDNFIQASEYHLPYISLQLLYKVGFFLASRFTGRAWQLVSLAAFVKQRHLLVELWGEIFSFATLQCCVLLLFFDLHH